MLPTIPWLLSASTRRRWLVGVSGGADSVALLQLLLDAGFKNLVVCHLDHGLRGKASAGDAKFVGKLAAKLGLPSEIGRVDLSGRKDSLETAARKARHDFFAECARKLRCPRIVLAHHADDQAETVLWNLLRGSHGFKGMRAEQNLTTSSGMNLEVHRPLLELRHAELVDWLLSRKLAWREDATNAQPIAVRNRLRNEALPLLAEISGRDPVAALVRGAADAEDAGALATWALTQSNVLDPQGRLHVPVLRALPPALQRLAFRAFLTDHGINDIDRAMLDRCLGLLDVKNPAAANLTGGAVLRRGGGRIRLER